MVFGALRGITLVAVPRRVRYAEETPETQLRFIADDLDSLEAKIDVLNAKIDGLRTVLIGLLISLTTASLLLVANLIATGG